MWVVKNKKYGMYYRCSINKELKHFVRDINEAKKMTKAYAKKVLSKMRKIENYELQEVKKWK